MSPARSTSNAPGVVLSQDADADAVRRNERRFRSLTESFTDFVWVCDARGNLLSDMRPWREVSRQSASELLGSGWLDSVHPDDRERVAARWETAVRDGGLYEIEYRVVGPAEFRWFEVRGAPVVGEDGTVDEWIGVGTDVTARRESEHRQRRLQAALDAERRTLEQVVAQAPAAVAVLWGPRHEIRYCNERYRALLPPGRDLVGRRLVEAVPEAKPTLPLLARALRGETVAVTELPLPFEGDGAHHGRRYYDFTYSPLLEGGVAVGVQVVATESTAAVRQRDALTRRLDAEHDVAERLQRALLPDTMPRLSGATVAVEYLPATADVGVGGDWYDALPVDDDRFLLAIGDVCGRGLQAATIMSQLRAAMRAYAIDSPRPADLLRGLATYCARIDVGDLVTVAIALVDRAQGRISVASAGHLPLLAVRPGEAPAYLPLGGDPPLGVDVAAYQETESPLPAGSLVGLFTDGVVEERGRPLDVCLEELRVAVAPAPRNPAGVARAISRYARAGGPLEDDAAIIVCATT